MERVAAVLVILFAVRAARGTPCEGGYYRELGCTPVYPEDKTCPIYYTCPNLHPDPTKCFYKGVSYNNEDLLPDSVVKNPCSVACYCDARAASGSGDAKPESSNQTRADWQTSFQCAAVDCVEDFTGEADAGEECVSTYAAGACCSSGKVCGKDAIAKLATCEVDGKTYREGQQFFPSGTCLSCLCTAQFNGTFEGAPYCRDIDCGIEIHSQMEIANKCAPVVMSGSSCCPHKWECPDNSTAVVRGSEASRVLSAQQARCQFGATSLAVGDSLTVGDKCIECSCRMPPLVSCVQQAGCEN